jgi:hypothetical protein
MKLVLNSVNEVFENAIHAALIARRQQRFWMTNLKKVQLPLVLAHKHVQLYCIPSQSWHLVTILCSLMNVQYISAQGLKMFISELNKIHICLKVAQHPPHVMMFVTLLSPTSGIYTAASHIEKESRHENITKNMRVGHKVSLQVKYL